MCPELRDGEKKMQKKARLKNQIAEGSCSIYFSHEFVALWEG